MESDVNIYPTAHSAAMSYEHMHGLKRLHKLFVYPMVLEIRKLNTCRVTSFFPAYDPGKINRGDSGVLIDSKE